MQENEDEDADKTEERIIMKNKINDHKRKIEINNHTFSIHLDLLSNVLSKTSHFYILYSFSIERKKLDKFPTKRTISYERSSSNDL